MSRGGFMLRKSSSDVRFDLSVLMETFRGGQSFTLSLRESR